jgi:sodium pump decarboxylase gamma subunit
MDNVWLITALGMGTVFLALIFLALITAFFPKVFGGRKEKVRPEAAPLPQMSGPTNLSVSALAPVPGSSPNGTIGPEIVAVIAAAVAAASGSSPESIRIASIHPSHDAGGFNTPIWGRIERFARN